LQCFKDLTRREFLMLSLLLLLVLIMGIFPNVFLKTFHFAVMALITY
jgi:NADH:ubiquinone oxidoreductase subunit 4 (subunit M)